MKLTRNQFEQLLPIVSESHDKKYLIGTCPFCGKDEFFILFKEDNHPCGCSRKKNCPWVGNIYTLLKALGRTKEFLSEREINIFEKLEGELNIIEKEELDLVMPEVKPPIFWTRLYEDEYLRKRGFTDYQFQKFEVGRSKANKDYITILTRRESKLVGYISRSDRSKDWIDNYNTNNDGIYLRYKNSKTDFSKTLFGIDEVVQDKTTDVILVEGIFSKTKTDTNLLLDEQDEIKCCATFGAKLSNEQRFLLKQKGIKNIWLWFEADVLKKIKSVAAEAALHFNVKVSYLNGKDPNDINQDEALELIDTAKDWLDFNTSYIESNLK